MKGYFELVQFADYNSICLCGPGEKIADQIETHLYTPCCEYVNGQFFRRADFAELTALCY